MEGFHVADTLLCWVPNAPLILYIPFHYEVFLYGLNYRAYLLEPQSSARSIWNETFPRIDYIKSQYSAFSIQHPWWKVDWKSVCNRRTGNLQSNRTNTSLTWDSISFALVSNQNVYPFNSIVCPFIFFESNVCCGLFLTDSRTSDTRQFKLFMFGLDLFLCGLLLFTVFTTIHLIYRPIMFQSKLVHQSVIDVGFFLLTLCMWPKTIWCDALISYIHNETFLNHLPFYGRLI